MAIDSNINKSLNTQRAISEKLIRPTVTNNITDVNQGSNSLAVTSTNIIIKANGIAIGLIQNFSISENRDVNKLQSIGVEGVVQSVPQNTKGGSISADRVALYGERLYDALRMDKISDPNKVFKTLKDQRIPFEIQVLTPITTDKDNPQYYSETYIDCWIQQYSKSYTVSTVTISEKATIVYADVI